MSKDKIIKLVIITIAIIFIVRGFLATFTKSTLAFDNFFTAAMILAVFFLYKKMHLGVGTMLFALFAFLLHHSYLYGNYYFGIPFDRIMHFTAGIAIAFVFYQYLSNSTKRLEKMAIFLLAVFLTMGFASTLETIEFFGYNYLGDGDGILFYGTGDFGEYNNTSWDLICNMFGAIFGASLFSIWTSKTAKKLLQKYKYE